MSEITLYSWNTEEAEEAQYQARQVLGLMSTGSVQTLLREIEAGHIAGSRYGDNLKHLSYLAPDEFCGCFLGWAGFLEQRSVLNLAYDLGWGEALLGVTALERFISRINRGMTPKNDADSAALYQFVKDYLTERLTAQEKGETK